MKKKDIDPLKKFRQIRENLSVRYWNDPESRLKKPTSKLSKISKVI